MRLRYAPDTAAAQWISGCRVLALALSATPFEDCGAPLRVGQVATLPLVVDQETQFCRRPVEEKGVIGLESRWSEGIWT